MAVILEIWDVWIDEETKYAIVQINYKNKSVLRLIWKKIDDEDN